MLDQKQRNQVHQHCLQGRGGLWVCGSRPCGPSSARSSTKHIRRHLDSHLTMKIGGTHFFLNQALCGIKPSREKSKRTDMAISKQENKQPDNRHQSDSNPLKPGLEFLAAKTPQQTKEKNTGRQASPKRCPRKIRQLYKHSTKVPKYS